MSPLLRLGPGALGSIRGGGFVARLVDLRSSKWGRFLSRMLFASTDIFSPRL